jgi:hypothetical protein
LNSSKEEKFFSIYSSRINRTIRIRPLSDENREKKDPKIQAEPKESSVQLQANSASGESLPLKSPNFDFT